MSEIAISIDLLDKGNGRSPFEELMSRLEKLSLEGDVSFDKSALEETVLFLERQSQDFSDIDSYKSKIILQAMNATVVMFDSSHSVKMITENLDKIKQVSVEMEKKNDIDYHSFLPSTVLKNLKGHSNKVTFSQLTETINEIYSKLSPQKTQQNCLEWEIELNFETASGENHKPLEFLHTFIEALNTIEGVKITLEDIKIGSLNAKMKAIFDDVKSKEEVKEALEHARKFAVGKLDKEYNESEKLNAEAKKAGIESDILIESLNNLKSPEYEELKKLESESLRYDNERKKLENQRLELQLFKERKEMLKELLAEGLINQENFEFLINGLPFLKLKNGTLTIGENMDIIDRGPL